MLLFRRGLFRNYKCDRTFVEGVVVRVLQFEEHFVRTSRKTHQDNRVATGICPNPWGIVESYMNVSHARRDRQSIRAEHRREMQVLRTVLDNRNAPGSKDPANGDR